MWTEKDTIGLIVSVLVSMITAIVVNKLYF